MLNSELICRDFTEKIARLLNDLKLLYGIKDSKMREAISKITPQELLDGYKVDSVEKVKMEYDKNIESKRQEIENLKENLYTKYNEDIKNEAREWYRNKDGELGKNVERVLNRESGILIYLKARYSDLFQKVYHEVGEEYYVKF